MEKRATCSINSELAANMGYDTSVNSRHTLLLANTHTHRQGHPHTHIHTFWHREELGERHKVIHGGKMLSPSVT